MKLETLFTHFENSIDSESLNSVKQRLNQLTPPEIALQIESTPSKFRKILWSLVDSKLSGLNISRCRFQYHPRCRLRCYFRQR